MVNELIALVIGAALSLGSVIVMQAWNARGSRKQERAEWVGKVLDENVIEGMSGNIHRPPERGELDRFIRRLPSVPYAMDVRHGGDFSTVSHRLRVTMGKIYDAHWTMRQERRPMPDGFLEYEETVRSDLDAWVRGKTKPKDLFTSIDFNQPRSAAVARRGRGGRRAGGLRHRLRAFGRRYVP